MITTEAAAGKSFFGRVVRLHARVLHLALARPLWLGLACIVMVIGTYFGYRQLGSDLLPAMDEGGFILDYIMPAGSSLTETNRVLEHVERIIRTAPEVDSTSRRTGLQMGLSPVTEANTGDMTVRLKSKRSRDIDEIIADIPRRDQGNRSRSSTSSSRRCCRT